MEFLVILGVLYGLLLLALPVLVFPLFSRIKRLEEKVIALQSQALPELAPAQSVAIQHPPAQKHGTVTAAADVSLPKTRATASAPPTANANPIPAQPAAFEAKHTPYATLLKPVRAWFVGGNILARIGVVVLFFGVAFLLKYTAQRGLFPIELRLLAVGLGAVALLATGLRLQNTRRNYGLVLEGGGIGILYTTLFAAVDRYDSLSPALGLTLMTVLVLVSHVFAVLHNARSLAILATVGGFLAPVLISSGTHPLFLFSYYGVLNLGIVALARYKSWRELDLLGFIFTFVISALWGYYHYQLSHFVITEAFLILFFMLYVAVPLIQPQPIKANSYVDIILLFAVPLAVFGIQGTLVGEQAYGLALSAIAMGIVYCLLALVLWRYRENTAGLLIDTFLALAVAFATLAVPLLVDGRWTGAAWTLEGATLVWVGVRQKQSLARLFGLVVQFAAGFAFLIAFSKPAAQVAVLNSVYLGGLMLSLCGLFSGLLLFRNKAALPSLEVNTPRIAWIWGLGWWFAAGFHEIWRHVAHADQIGAVLFFVALSCAAMALLSRRLNWHEISLPGLGLLPTMVIVGFALAAGQADTHPFARWRVLAWLTAFAIHYRLLRWFETSWPALAVRLGHRGALWFGTFLMTWELAWLVDQMTGVNPTWSYSVWGFVPCSITFGLLLWGSRLDWPVQRFQDGYLATGLTPIILWISLWLIHASFQSGNPRPFLYWPLLHPLELVQLFILFTLSTWLRSAPLQLYSHVRWHSWAALVFITVNGIVARATHFWGKIPFEAFALLESALFQAAISVTWTVLALITMVAATRYNHRPFWLSGSLLLGAVVIKLFLIDLSGIATLGRIVSFLGVGLLILVIGYVSPLPPQPKDDSPPQINK